MESCNIGLHAFILAVRQLNMLMIEESQSLTVHAELYQVTLY